jgi:type II secretory pathway component GspD/PulD (secretin)
MKKLSFIFALIICSAISTFAQNTDSKKTSQCKYGEKDFVGEAIDLSLVNADIRDFLSFITQQYGCAFVIDKSVKEIPTTVNLHDIPWNVALDEILKSYGLDKMNKKSRNALTQIEKPYIYIATKEKILSEIEWWKNCYKEEISLDKQSLYTEFIKLSKIPKEKKEKYAENIITICKRRLSRRGAIEFETNSATIVVIDVKENIEAIKQLVKLLEILDNGEIENKDKKKNP